MVKPVGGRGKKAPYETVVMRIPKDLEPIAEELCDKYRNISLNDLSTKYLVPAHYTFVDIGELSNIMAVILKQKKSARQSFIKLLQVLFPDIAVDQDDINL